MSIESGSAGDNPATIADLIWETDPEMCQYVFGDRPTWHRYFEIEWLSAISLHSSGCAMVVKQRGMIDGLVIAYPQSEMTARYTATVARYETAVGQRMENVGWLFPTLPEKALYVFNLAVSHFRRGHGTGRLLMSAMEQQAQRTGMTTVHLDVPATSPAVQFYERIGYRKLSKTELLEPRTNIPPHFRMCKHLSS
jgi:ribosomal protein S18 acetylase RimI-like enzyme